MRLLIFITFMLLSCALHAAGSSRADYICSVVSDPSEQALCTDRASTFVENESNASRRESISLLSIFWPVSWWVFYYGAGLLIGRYVYRDAKRRDWLFLGLRPLWWAVITLFDPAFGVLLYWAVHYSKFAQNYPGMVASPSPGADL